jgi:signal transduction histidine kinase
MMVLPWRRMGFRIAMTIVVALVAIQGLNLLAFRLAPRLAPHPLGVRRLADMIAAEAPRAFAAAPGAVGIADPEAARVLTLRRVEGFSGGRVIDHGLPYDLQALAATLKARAPEIAEVRLADDFPFAFRLLGLLGWGPGGPRPRPEQAGAPVAPLDDAGPDVGYFGPLRFALRGPSNAWAMVGDARDDGIWSPRAALPLISLLTSLLAIFALAQWFARRETRPLRALAETAERIGRDRGHERARLVPLGGSHEVMALGDALNRMQDRIAAFLDERRLMLAALSHDLRTPLTRMRLAAHAIADPAQRAELIAEIEEMTLLVESTLRFARDDAADEPRRATDLAILAQSLCDDVNDRGGRASYRGPDRCILDLQPLAIKRALTNVIENACKFGEAAELELEDRGDAATIEILDRGPGIPPELREEAFTPFRRLETSAENRPGSGLGLTIARDAILAQGGDIRLENRESGGLRVAIRLPRGGEAHTS